MNKTNSNPIQGNKPMKKILNLVVGLTAIGLASSEAATTYTDGIGENIRNHAPADILYAEVSNNNDDLVFKVTVGGIS